jgi:hypothetical protein
MKKLPNKKILNTSISRQKKRMLLRRKPPETNLPAKTKTIPMIEHALVA